ncbi:hypothetical protein [Janthinobacterium sp. PC23-8]|uniref:hypothetical protein n=1 Tax=Janthinobacterium sp. PC23-8 TaxID=2012679 RepID=UPI0015955EFE|nr:hypothetical protein [Janthinobacterium sp. PC23-8]
MKISEIKKELKSKKIPESAYSINKVKEESLCILKRKEFFEIFYYERGLENNKISFKEEDDACNYFINELKSWF